MVTSGRILVCVVGAMCASAPPAGGFAPPGYLSNMQSRATGKSCTSRRARCAPRVSGAAEAFYSTERRLHDAGRKAGYGERHGGLRAAGCRRRRSNVAVRMMSTVAPSANKVERPPPRAPVPPEIRPEEELRLKMEEAGIKRPKSTSVSSSSVTSSQSRPRSLSPQMSAERRAVRPSHRDGSSSSGNIKINFAPEHAGRHPTDMSASVARGAGGTSLQFYLRNMTKTQLLKAEEEKILGRQIQKGMQYMKVRDHLTSMRGVPPTNEEWSYAVGIDAEELLAQLNRAERAKVAMINANLRLVVSVTKRYRLLGVALTDLIQEGTFGLMRAAEKFDPERGFRFSTYAVWWIRQAAMRGVMDQSRVVRLPVHVHQLLLQVKKATKELQEVEGTAPEDEAVGNALGTTTRRIQFYRKAAQAIVSMQTKTVGHKPQDSTKEDEMGDIVKSVSLSPETDVSTVVLKDRVVRLLSTLNDREREVMRARFGIDGDRRRTLEGIGQRYGLSRERVRQIEMDALLKLRRPYHAYRELEVSAEQLMIYEETRAPDAAAVEAASAEVEKAEAAAKVAQLNYMRARLGMPRAKPEAEVRTNDARDGTSSPRRAEEVSKPESREELAEPAAGPDVDIFSSGAADPSLTGESPEDWARRILSQEPLLGTEADKRAYGGRGTRWRPGDSNGQAGASGADSYPTVEISAKSLMTLAGDEREAWSSIIEQTEPWSGPVKGKGSGGEPPSLEVAAEEWSFGVESARLSGDMTPEQWERALTAME